MDIVPLTVKGAYALVPVLRSPYCKVDLLDWPLVGCRKWTRYISSEKHIYPQTGRCRSGIVMHRLLMSAQPGDVIDHKNHDTFDNRRSNLRRCTLRQNSQNRKLRSDSTTGFKGVCYLKNRKCWQAYIWLNGTRRRLGDFKSPEQAARAYDAAASELFGEFAMTNADQGLLPCNQSGDAA